MAAVSPRAARWSRPERRQGATEAQPLRVRVDADHVDLADRAPGRARPRGAPWSTPSPAGCRRAPPAGSRRGRTTAPTPGRAGPPTSSGPAPGGARTRASSRGATRPRRAPARTARTETPVGRPAVLGGRAVRSSRICRSSRTTGMSVSCANARAAGRSPCAQTRSSRPGTTVVSASARASSARPTPAAAVRRVDHQLGLDRRLRADVQLRVADQAAGAGRVQVDHRGLRLAQPEQRLLRQRGDAVRGGRPVREGADGVGGRGGAAGRPSH